LRSIVFHLMSILAMVHRSVLFMAMSAWFCSSTSSFTRRRAFVEGISSMTRFTVVLLL
jgi:hypothetical protein